MKEEDCLSTCLFSMIFNFEGVAFYDLIEIIPDMCVLALVLVVLSFWRKLNKVRK